MQVNENSDMKRRWLVIAGLLIVVAAVVAFIALGNFRQHAEAVNCGNQMIAIGFATRLWADDHGGSLPPDLSTMSNEINAPKILICPSDHSRQPATNWSLGTNNFSYQTVASGSNSVGSKDSFMRCPVHGYILRMDGAVFNGDKQLRKGIW